MHKSPVGRRRVCRKQFDGCRATTREIRLRDPESWSKDKRKGRQLRRQTVRRSADRAATGRVKRQMEKAQKDQGHPEGIWPRRKARPFCAISSKGSDPSSWHSQISGWPESSDSKAIPSVKGVEGAFYEVNVPGDTSATFRFRISLKPGWGNRMPAGRSTDQPPALLR